MGTVTPLFGFTPAVICPFHYRIELTYGEYLKQSYSSDNVWWCPRCGMNAEFDDDSFRGV
jgi:hypothetical protein